MRLIPAAFFLMASDSAVREETRKFLAPAQKDFLRNFSRRILGYALGRELNKFDECVLTDSANAPCRQRQSRADSDDRAEQAVLV